MITLPPLPLNPWLTIGLILSVLVGLMVGLRLYQDYFSPHPELVRKLLHIPMGLITLSFPWLFDETLPVLVLAGIAIVWLLALRLYKPLATRLGSVLGDVGRRSLGEIYFPIAVGLLFLLSQGDPLLFCIPMLILTLADAVAAVIGVRYGQFHYTTTDGHKSAEGSISFFTITFLSVHIPLLLLTDTGRAETLLIGLILALLVMLIEAIAWQGLDNLFIPLGGFILLRLYLEMDAAMLLVRLIVTLILVIFALCWRQRTTLNDSALLGAAFVGYLSWTLGGWRWLLAPAILFLTYPLLISWIKQREIPFSPEERQAMPWIPLESDPKYPNAHWERIHNIYAVLSVAAAGLLWLFLFGAFDRPEFLYPYTLSFAANLAIIGIAGLSPLNYWQPSNLVLLVTYILKGWLLMFAPLLLLQGLSRPSISGVMVSLVGTALPAIAYYLTQPTLRKRPTDTLNWLFRTGYTTIGSLLGLIPYLVQL
jgi:phytol kinase